MGASLRITLFRSPGRPRLRYNRKSQSFARVATAAERLPALLAHRIPAGPENRSVQAPCHKIHVMRTGRVGAAADRKATDSTSFRRSLRAVGHQVCLPSSRLRFARESNQFDSRSPIRWATDQLFQNHGTFLIQSVDDSSNHVPVRNDAGITSRGNTYGLRALVVRQGFDMPASFGSIDKGVW
jgi:hypothetical protein